MHHWGKIMMMTIINLGGKQTAIRADRYAPDILLTSKLVTQMALYSLMWINRFNTNKAHL